MNINIEYLKCRHGFEKRFGMCPECIKEKQNFLSYAFEPEIKDVRIPIKRGCMANGPCFCDGSCQEIIGYRDPIFPGEKP